MSIYCDYDVMMMLRATPGALERIMRGETVTMGSAVFALCQRCRSVIKLNKFLFGSTHLCA